MKKIKVLLVLIMLSLSSCIENCYDEVTYHYEDGTKETVWVEYDCYNNN